MSTHEIKIKINSINYFHNRYLKNGALNICDVILKSKIIDDNIKNEIKTIKNQIQLIDVLWTWNDNPKYDNINSVRLFLDEINELLID